MVNNLNKTIVQTDKGVTMVSNVLCDTTFTTFRIGKGDGKGAKSMNSIEQNQTSYRSILSRK